MRADVNKHGLKRYISSDIKNKIRKDAGFGCVLCGSVLVDYEHIEPEWHDATEHDPDKMTLLCIGCHGKVTRKHISKNKVWEAKKSPKALEKGYVHDILFVNTDDMEIKIGNSTSKRTKTILTIHGKPIIWFEPPTIPNEPSKLCAIFYDYNSKPIAYINRNQFIALTSNTDIKSESTYLSIVVSGKICLLIDREGDKSLHIKKLDGSYFDASVSIENTGTLLIKHGTSQMSMGRMNIENCGSAIVLGTILSINKYDKFSIANQLLSAPHSKKIYAYSGSQVGWEMNGEIFNMKYEIVGFKKNSQAYNITGEYIGNIVNGHIVYPDDSYETNEPIYISNNNRAFRFIHITSCFDVSFRLFQI